MIKAIKPDVLISDIKMPGLSGIELIQRIVDAAYQTSVIFITGFQEFEYAQKAIRYGAVDFLLKPIKNDDLIAAIQRACAKQNEAIPEESQQDSLSEIRTVALATCLTIEKNIYEDDHSIDEKTSDIVQKINSCRNLMEITEFVDGFLERLKTYVSKEKISPITQNVLDYIRELYDKNLTLPETAQKIFLNPSYLSRLLKKETDKNFTDILAEIGIEHAKKIIGTSGFKNIGCRTSFRIFRLHLFFSRFQ
ncbi:MAG: response regulator [Ruthenibacterium sp.]